jgi:RNA polymerase sigma-70 factor (ECF subfamily)
MATHLTPSDDELLRLIMAGDEAAFTTLYRRRSTGVYRFALQMSGSEATAEDVTQEVFIVLMREGHRFDPMRGTVSAYLYGVARNHVLRRFARDRVFVPLAAEQDETETDATCNFVSGDDPLGDLTRTETIEAVRQAVLTLPAHYREVVVLCELHEMSYAEAAGVLNCAVGTIRSRLHRARAMLVKRLRGRKELGGSAEQPLSEVRCFA